MCSTVVISDSSGNGIRFYKGVGIDSNWVNGSIVFHVACLTRTKLSELAEGPTSKRHLGALAGTEA